MAIYNIHYTCDECGGWHSIAAKVLFPDSKFDGQSVNVAYAGRTLSSNIKVMQEPNKLHCPVKNKPTSQPDLSKIFLSLAEKG